MSNVPAVVDQSGTPMRDRYDDPGLVAVIKQTVAKGASDAQLRMFLEVCRRTGLDPFLKEIWYVAEKGLIMAARDGYLRVANESPQFDGLETRVERDEKRVPIKAVCTVWRKDRSHPVICEAYYSEYKKASPVWTQYPSAMISKVAEVLALKRSFAINGVVTEEEVGHDGAGSREAAQSVAAEKIRVMREAAGEAVDTPVEIATPKSEAHKKLVSAFSELRGQFSAIAQEEAYGNVLEQCGVSDAADFDDTKEGLAAARKCYKQMGASLAVLKEAPNEEIDEDGFPGIFTIAGCVEKFGALKDRLKTAAGVSAGEAEYYRILKAHGVLKSNQFRSAEKATPCYIEMLESVKQIEALAGDGGQL